MAIDTKALTIASEADFGFESPYLTLLPLLEQYRGEQHLILIQGSPDPDAISSALALEFLCSAFDIPCTLLCFQHVSHHENRALVKRLGIKLVRYDEAMDLEPFAIYSIVDSQKTDSPISEQLEQAGVKLFAFVDHHRVDVNNEIDALYVDVRENVASTAAIFCEYLQQLFPKGLEPSDPLQVRLATALMHGLRSDTSKFILASSLEYEAASYLAPCVDHQVLEVIERKILTTPTLGILENALVNRRVHDNFIYSHVGYVRSVDRDGIPQAAELLLNREGTDTVLVWGVVDETYIDGSLRTRSETISPDEFLKGFLGISPENGRYYGGGNVRDRGGFQIPLGFLGLSPDKTLLYNLAKEIIEKAFFDATGKTAKEK